MIGRLEDDALEARVIGIRPKAGDRLKQPLADRAVGIVVVGVHPGRMRAAIGLDGVPAFPDRGGSRLHLIEPAGRFLLQEERCGQLVFADLRQRRQQRGRADEAGPDAAITSRDRRLEVSDRGGQQLRGNKVVQNRERI